MPDSTPPPVEIAEPEAETLVELRTVFLGGLLLLAMLAACYIAAEIVLPIVLAFVLGAMLQPVLRFLLRIHVPRVLAALSIVLALVTVFMVLALLLSGPLAQLIGQMPQTLPKLQERLNFLSAPIRSIGRALEHVESLGPGGGQPQPVAVQGPTLPEKVLQQVRVVGEGAFGTLLMLFFVLIAGDQFLRRLVEILPGFKEKRKAVDISQQIEHDISIYLATITVMNALVGLATAGMAWLTGLGSPLLWGTVAFLLNFVPILGPTAGVIIFLIAGIVTIEPLWAAFLPALLYFLIHCAEGETATPMLLAARFTVNPVLVTIGVIFWYWMWGVAGAILATPMLAIFKIICDRIEMLRPVGHFIGGEPAIGAIGAITPDK
ncbi:MAG TPA: AI-2E family transporter [Acetobacteraceae bacterium]|jgi:predicted PurR-regulated permease PerM|nr:AI-2E family transporter [Acetobacteraceae bacterium]